MASLTLMNRILELGITHKQGHRLRGYAKGTYEGKLHLCTINSFARGANLIPVLLKDDSGQVQRLDDLINSETNYVGRVWAEYLPLGKRKVFAEEIGLNQVYLSRWINAANTPDIDSFELISHALNLKPEYLVKPEQLKLYCQQSKSIGASSCIIT